MTEKADVNAEAGTDILLAKAADPRPMMGQLITTLRDLSQDAAFRADGLEKLLAEYNERNG